MKISRPPENPDTRNKKQAQELHDRLKAELWREDHLDELPDHTWEDAVKRFLSEEAGRPGLWHDAQMLDWLTPRLEGKNLTEIDGDLIAKLLAERAEVIVNGKTGRKTSPSTINRHSSILGKVLRKAKRWRWLTAVPDISKRREPNGRVRYLSPDEHRALLAALPEPWKACAKFTLATGLREDNCTHLEWTQVSYPMRQAWVHADDVKTNKSLLVPLNDDAMPAQPAGRAARISGPAGGPLSTGPSCKSSLRSSHTSKINVSYCLLFRGPAPYRHQAVVPYDIVAIERNHEIITGPAPSFWRNVLNRPHPAPPGALCIAKVGDVPAKAMRSADPCVLPALTDCPEPHGDQPAVEHDAIAHLGHASIRVCRSLARLSAAAATSPS